MPLTHTDPTTPRPAGRATSRSATRSARACGTRTPARRTTSAAGRRRVGVRQRHHRPGEWSSGSASSPAHSAPVGPVPHRGRTLVGRGRAAVRRGRAVVPRGRGLVGRGRAVVMPEGGRSPIAIRSPRVRVRPLPRCDPEGRPGGSPRVQPALGRLADRPALGPRYRHRRTGRRGAAGRDATAPRTSPRASVGPIARGGVGRAPPRGFAGGEPRPR